MIMYNTPIYHERKDVMSMSVIDDIKAEIDHDLKNAPYWYDEEHLDELNGFQDGLERAMKIINKHIVERSEDAKDSKNEHTCETCIYGKWKRKGWDITMSDDECGGCCSWNDKWKQLYTERNEDDRQCSK